MAGVRPSRSPVAIGTRSRSTYGGSDLSQLLVSGPVWRLSSAVVLHVANQMVVDLSMVAGRCHSPLAHYLLKWYHVS